MKLLKIDDSHEAFFKKDEDWVSVTAIERDDLASLIALLQAKIKLS